MDDLDLCPHRFRSQYGADPALVTSMDLLEWNQHGGRAVLLHLSVIFDTIVLPARGAVLSLLWRWHYSFQVGSSKQ